MLPAKGIRLRSTLKKEGTIVSCRHRLRGLDTTYLFVCNLVAQSVLKPVIRPGDCFN